MNIPVGEGFYPFPNFSANPGFLSLVLGANARLSMLFKKICEKAQRFFEIATFFHYPVADGIHRVLFGVPAQPMTEPPDKPDRQLRFAFDRPPT